MSDPAHDPSTYLGLAAALERLSDDAHTRLGRGRTERDLLRARTDELTEAWRSPVSRELSAGAGAYFVGLQAGTEDGLAAYTAMHWVALAARQAARELEEVKAVERSLGEPLDKPWNQQTVANWSEWQDRATTAAGGIVRRDDRASAELTARYQEQTRRREAAVQRRDAAVRRWVQACGDAVDVVNRATATFDRCAGSAIEVLRPPTFDRLPPGVDPTAPDQARKEFLTALRDGSKVDTARIDALLGRLTPAEVLALVSGLRTIDVVAWLSALSPADRARATGLLGAAAATATRDALTAAGLHPDHFDPADLQGMDPASDAYRVLIATLTRAGHVVTEPDIAGRYYHDLGAEGIRASLGALDEGFLHNAHGGPSAVTSQRLDTVLVGFVAAFAATTGRPETAEVRARLLDIDTGWQRHQLGLLLSGPPAAYDAGFVRDGAYAILVGGADLCLPRDINLAGHPELVEHYGADRMYPGLYEVVRRYGDDDLHNAEVVALRALRDNPQAALAFVHHDGQVDQRALGVLLHPGDDRDRVARLSNGYQWALAGDTQAGERFAWMQRLGNRAGDYNRAVLTTLILDIPPGVPVERSTDIYAEVVRQIGQGDVPVEYRRMSAEALPRNLDAMIELIDLHKHNMIPSGQFDRPDLVNYFAQIADDPRSSALVGSALAQHAIVATDGITERKGTSRRGPAADTFEGLADIMATVEDGFGEADKARSESAAALTVAMETMVDALVAAGMALPIVVSAGAATPAVAVGGASGGEVLKGVGKKVADAIIDANLPTTEGGIEDFRKRFQAQVDAQLAARLSQKFPTIDEAMTLEAQDGQQIVKQWTDADYIGRAPDGLDMQPAVGLTEKAFVRANMNDAKAQWGTPK
jgi:hypothetical protein